MLTYKKNTTINTWHNKQLSNSNHLLHQEQVQVLRRVLHHLPATLLLLLHHHLVKLLRHRHHPMAMVL
jgi:hypothetical protein